PLPLPTHAFPSRTFLLAMPGGIDVSLRDHTIPRTVICTLLPPHHLFFVPRHSPSSTLFPYTTLFRSVLMLSSLDDPASLGPNMAVALLTTLYGTILANLVFLPMASKLEIKTEEDIFMKQIIIEGIIGVQSGQSPHIL